MANYIPKISYEHPTLGTTEINFTLPPVGDPLGETLRSRTRETKSGSGRTQAQFQYFIRSFRIKYTFITKAIIDELETFFLEYAGKGANEFDYYPSNDESAFYRCILTKPTFKPQRVIRDGVDFVYDFEFLLEVVP